MRRVFAMLLVAALACASTGCARRAKKTPTEAGSAIVYTAPLAGAWELSCERANPVLIPSQRKLFEEATSTWDDVRYEPLVVIAEQAGGGGSSFAYLCRGAQDNPDAASGWTIVVVFKNPKGNVRVSSIRELNPAGLQLVEPTDSMVFGTWPAAEIPRGNALPEVVQKAFELAVGSSSYDLKPIILLGTQTLPDSSNYAVLCYGDGDGVTNAVFVATIHHASDGTVTLTSANVLAMTYYVSGQAAAPQAEE